MLYKFFAATGRVLALACASLCLVSYAQAFDSNQKPESALAALKRTDCDRQAQECRYYGAVELAAYFDVCPREFARRNHIVASPEDLRVVRQIFEAWVSVSDPEVRAAVLAPRNPLRDMLTQDTQEFLQALDDDEFALECKRLAKVKSQRPVEELSELLAKHRALHPR